MRIFEFHFNPKAKEDLAFDSYCYEPENVYEKKLGSLFLVGEIKNALPQHLRLLEKFSSFFKKEYYAKAGKFSPESSLKHSLKDANEYLEKIVKSGDVSWLGNLNLAILSVKNFNLNFAKAGDLAILLLREGQATDIGKKLEFEDMEPYPLKIFGKIVSGKLAEGDILLVLTKEVFNFFSNPLKSLDGKPVRNGQTLIGEIMKMRPFEEQKLKALLRNREKELLKISGVCLLLLFSKDEYSENQRQRSFNFQAKPEKFSLREPFLPFIKAFGKAKSYCKKTLLKFNAAGKNLLKLKEFKLKSKLRIPKIKAGSKSGIKIPAILLRKNAVLILSLTLILLLGSLLFQKQERDKLKMIETAMAEIRQEILQAEDYLALDNDKKAYEIYKKALEQVILISKEKSALQDEALALENSIEENLEKISKLEKVSDPELLFEFDEKEFIPQKMVLFQSNFYFFSPLSGDAYKVDLAGEKSVLNLGQPFSEAVDFGSQILCFQKPNLVFFLRNNSLSEPFSLTLPYSGFNLKTLAVYRSNLYFLDAEAGEITKYEYPVTENKDFPQTWLVKGTQKVDGAKSMAIDGPIWILNKDNAVSQYYNGNFRKTMALDIFPVPENLSKIQALYGLFYILEPSKKRLIIMTEGGEVVKQFQSEKFDNLKDFSVSSTGRTIWLLNGVKIFKVSF